MIMETSQTLLQTVCACYQWDWSLMRENVWKLASNKGKVLEDYDEYGSWNWGKLIIEFWLHFSIVECSIHERMSQNQNEMKTKYIENLKPVMWICFFNFCNLLKRLKVSFNRISSFCS